MRTLWPSGVCSVRAFRVRSVPEYLIHMLDVLDGNCTMSAWGKIIWDETQRGLYSSILSPVSDRIIITRKAQRAVPPNRMEDFNKAIDELSRYVDGGMRRSLNSSNPVNLRAILCRRRFTSSICGLIQMMFGPRCLHGCTSADSAQEPGAAAGGSHARQIPQNSPRY